MTRWVVIDWIQPFLPTHTSLLLAALGVEDKYYLVTYLYMFFTRQSSLAWHIVPVTPYHNCMSSLPGAFVHQMLYLNIPFYTFHSKPFVYTLHITPDTVLPCFFLLLLFLCIRDQRFIRVTSGMILGIISMRLQLSLSLNKWFVTKDDNSHGNYEQCKVSNMALIWIIGPSQPLISHFKKYFKQRL